MYVWNSNCGINRLLGYEFEGDWDGLERGMRRKIFLIINNFNILYNYISIIRYWLFYWDLVLKLYCIKNYIDK